MEIQSLWIPHGESRTQRSWRSSGSIRRKSWKYCCDSLGSWKTSNLMILKISSMEMSTFQTHVAQMFAFDVENATKGMCSCCLLITQHTHIWRHHILLLILLLPTQNWQPYKLTTVKALYLKLTAPTNVERHVSLWVERVTNLCLLRMGPLQCQNCPWGRKLSNSLLYKPAQCKANIRGGFCVTVGKHKLRQRANITKPSQTTGVTWSW